MKLEHSSRRDFLLRASAMTASCALPSSLLQAQTTIRNRFEWTQFRSTAAYGSFINAIRSMRSNTNSSDRRSWEYWVNAHVTACRHGISYFLAWHRGYLHYFQQTLREISGNSTLTLPYWDYYANPVMPSEFTDPASNNPLYVPGRLNTNVRSALSLTPFSIQYSTFQRGTPNSFETFLEYRPHGSFHNVVGGVMTGLRSPEDPIFWLHHAQIDRLWAAWVLAGAGRQMPPRTDAYWSGTHTYTPTLTMARNQTYDTRTNLFYDYVNRTLPTSLPPLAQTGGLVRAAFAEPDGVLQRPPVKRFPAAIPRQIDGRRSIGGARAITLNENSVSVDVGLGGDDSRDLNAISGSDDGTAPAQPRPAPAYLYADLVLDQVRVTSSGQDGGYYYDIYLNLPLDSTVEDPRLHAGSFGPFEIAAHRHHGDSSQLIFPITEILRSLDPRELRNLTISFVRREGSNAPDGVVVIVGEARIELSRQRER